MSGHESTIMHFPSAIIRRTLCIIICRSFHACIGCPMWWYWARTVVCRWMEQRVVTKAALFVSRSQRLCGRVPRRDDDGDRSVRQQLWRAIKLVSLGAVDAWVVRTVGTARMAGEAVGKEEIGRGRGIRTTDLPRSAKSQSNVISIFTWAGCVCLSVFRCPWLWLYV